MGIGFNALPVTPASSSGFNSFRNGSYMRTTFRFFGIALGILLAMPAWAQVESTQQQTTTAPAPTISQEQAPAMPSIQDVRSPLNTISNRPRATTGAQTGGAAGTGQTAL